MNAILTALDVGALGGATLSFLVSIAMLWNAIDSPHAPSSNRGTLTILWTCIGWLILRNIRVIAGF